MTLSVTIADVSIALGREQRAGFPPPEHGSQKGTPLLEVVWVHRRVVYSVPSLDGAQAGRLCWRPCALLLLYVDREPQGMCCLWCLPLLLVLYITPLPFTAPLEQPKLIP